MKPNNIENYSTDRPIIDPQKDRFQRFAFSKRIAETIIQREADESIVIGIYGDWGEGKTSVLNFIEDTLSKDANTITCKFNPWRFQDETQLLIGFFKLLATNLGKSITKKAEKISELFSEYAEVFIPNITLGGLVEFNPSQGVKKIAEKIANIDIEEQKKRIEEILKKAKKRVVVFIDDIDRLDKKEVQTVFKLVKLTGDFSFTSYILAFDEKMVAKAIGEIYEDGGEQAGRNFLEKIIQVPLRLPLAQRDVLKKFCFEHVENAIKTNNIHLSEDQAGRFVNEFTTNILSRLSTPRSAVRYGNTLSFSLPLLDKEVNITDLMLIEAIKIFYPELYIFIRDNPWYFVQSYSIIDLHDIKENKKEQCKNSIKKIAEIYSDRENKMIINLLIELFPILKEVYDNYTHSENSYKEWYKDKRIGSPQYFQRYFSYSVLDGEISDILVKNLLNTIESSTHLENIRILNEALISISPDALVSKLRWLVEDYSPELSKKLAVSFSEFGDLFSYNHNSLFGFDTPLGQVALFIYKLICNLPKGDQQFELAKEAVLKSKPFSLSYELIRWLGRDGNKNPEEPSISNEQLNELKKILLDKAISDASDESIFEKYPRYAVYLLSHVWLTVKGKEDLMFYLRGILDNNPDKISKLLKAYSPYTHSSVQSEPFYGDLQYESFDTLKNTFDINYLYSAVVKVFGVLPDNYVFTELDHLQTEQNRAMQFLRHYKIFGGEELKKNSAPEK